MIDNSIRKAFESIDDDASDEFREGLRRKCLAELSAADTRPGRAPTDVHFVPAKEMSMSIDSPTTGTSNRRHLLMVAAAVVVVLGIASVALANRNSDDGQTPSAPAAATVASTTVVPTTVVPTTKTVSFAEESASGIPVSFTAPADWTVADGWSAYKLGADSMATVGVNFDQIANVYADGCQWVQLDPPLGPTVDDLVQAWTNLPGFAATAALDVTVDGYTGKQIEFTLPEYNKDDCKASLFGLWYAGPDPLPGVIPPGFWAQGPDQRTKQWILDVDGTRLVITANSLSSASPQDLADLEEAVASIQIG